MNKCSICETTYPGATCPKCMADFLKRPTEPTAPNEDPPLRTGQTFHGLEVLEIHGRGGMGVVYKARQPGLNRIVALKILPKKLAEDPEFQARFQLEAQVLATLTHPNIVSVYDFGSEGSLFFFVMEFVDGVNLREILREEKLKPEEAFKIVPQLCDALEYAHGEGVVHRDIKPENILIDKKGRVKIADFGLAKLSGQTPERSTFTQTDVAMGTPAYMAPEQMENTKTVDHRADIYSMGVVFYEMLTGELPVGRFEPPSKKVQVDVRLDEVVLKTLEREPERRYQRAILVKEAVTKATVPADRAGQAVPRWAMPKRVVQLGTAVIVLFAVLGTILLWRPWVPSERTSEGPRLSEEQHRLLVGEEPPSRKTLDLGGGTTLDLVYLTPGVTTMGGSEAPRHVWQADERPEHPVTITKDFFLGKTEVTRGQFAAFVKATGYLTEAERSGKAFGRRTDGGWGEIAGAIWRDPVLFHQTDDHPVVCVSWNDAKAFCGWLAMKTVSAVRLPTEAEWEYACRAGTKTRWSFGDDEAKFKHYGWYNGISEWQTHPVGQKKPNAWNLFDLHGNVWEWCEGWPGLYPAGEVTDPPGAASGDRRSMRGGGWYHGPTDCRSAFRGTYPPSDRNTNSGFRIALSATQSWGPDVDLLKLIDAKDDAVKGEWRMEGQTLVSPRGAEDRLQVPYLPPEEYDLSLVVELQEGEDSFAIGLACSKTQFMVVLNGWPDVGPLSGINQVDGKSGNANETTRKGQLFTKGKPATVFCSLRKGGVRVFVDGKKVINWSGDLRRLRSNTGFTVPNPRALLIGSWVSKYRISRLVLTPVSGPGESLR